MAVATLPKYAVLVIEHDGEQHYIRNGADHDSGPVAVWRSKRRAEESAAVWREGLGGDVASVNVVRYRGPGKGA